MAEEGLDIQECNLVVRYGLLTNEIAQQQAMGRARANDSVYAVVAQRGSKEVVREFVNDNRVKSMAEAIAEIQKMTRMEFCKKVSQVKFICIAKFHMVNTDPFRIRL